MPLSTKTNDNHDILSVDLTVNGQHLKDDLMPTLIDIDRSINKIGVAKISFWLPLGDGQNETFGMSELDQIEPGNTIEIKMGYVYDKTTVFKGIIVHLGIRNINKQYNELVLRCSDTAVKMTQGSSSAFFQNMPDNTILSKIIGNHGLTAKVVNTTGQHQQFVQYQTNDWDFVVARAAANGLFAYTDNDTVLVQKPHSGSSALTLDFEDGIIAFDLSLEARLQQKQVSCKAWDMKTQTMAEAQSTEPSVTSPGNITPKKLSNAIDFLPTKMDTSAPLETSELKTWADAHLLAARLSALQGNVKFQGTGVPALNTTIELKGFGARFNGNALITSLQHTVQNGRWETTVGFGMPHIPPVSVQTTAPAHGLLSAVQGLQTGTVKKVADDPNGAFRIMVSIPVLDPEGVGIWARMAHFYATAGKGSFFLPEVNDEVIVGFLDDDPRFPVILGMLYSSKNKPPYAPNEKNTIKALVSKNGFKIEINEEEKTLVIETPEKNAFILSDKNKSIELKDPNGNKISMNSDGIQIESAKNLILKAASAININATEKITAASSGGDIGLEGLNVSAKAKMAFSAQGSASAELKASGTTTVKGAIVMIN